MSMYDGIQEVKPTRKQSQGETIWIGPGRYELEVVRVADGRADQGEGRPYFVVIAATTGSSPSEVTPDVVATCTSEDQPLVGTVVSATAYNKPSQSTGRDFTVVTYKTRKDN